MQVVLFLCTGNYYRSRFAEMLFNHLAGEKGLPWRAESRGLATERGFYNVGPIARHTIEALCRLGVPQPGEHRNPMACNEVDLTSARIVIALKEVEHRPLVRQQFGDWEHRLRYWHVHDLDQSTAAVALAEIESLVQSLINKLAGG